MSAALPRAARRGRLVGVLMPGVEALRVRWGARVVGDVGERLPVESVEGSAGRSQRRGWGNDRGLLWSELSISLDQCLRFLAPGERDLMAY